jgi:hypothetical protein
MIIKRLMLIAILLTPALGQAATYTVDVSDESGGSVTGTFNWVVPQIFSAVSVTATGADFTNGGSGLFEEVVFGNTGGFTLVLPVDRSGTQAVRLNLASEITGAAETIAVTSVVTYDCDNVICTSWTSTATLSGYTGTVSSVPLPAAAWLFGSALVGLVGSGRRKKAQV